MSGRHEARTTAVTDQLNVLRLKFLEGVIGKNCVMTQQEMADEMNVCE